MVQADHFNQDRQGYVTVTDNPEIPMGYGAVAFLAHI